MTSGCAADWHVWSLVWSVADGVSVADDKLIGDVAEGIVVPSGLRCTCYQPIGGRGRRFQDRDERPRRRPGMLPIYLHHPQPYPYNLDLILVLWLS